MTDRSKTLWTFAITSIALFMVSLDNLVVSTAIPVIRTDLNASLEDLSWTVNAYTLTFAVLLLTGAALGDRFGRRRMFAIGVGIFTAASVARSARTERGGAQHRPGDPGPRRRDRDAADADDPLRRRPAREARPRARRVGCDRWRRDRPRARRRRRRRRGLLLAVHLLAQRSRSGSCSCRSRCFGSPRRTARRASSTSPASVSSARACSGSCGVSIRGNEQGWTSPEILAAFGLGFAFVAAFVAWELRAPSPMLPMTLLPQQGVLAREPRLAVDVLRDVRLDLPADPVLPDRPGLLAAQLGAAHPPVDACADVRRSVRRCDVRQGQPEADPRRSV